MARRKETPHLDKWIQTFRSVGSNVGKIAGMTLGEMAPGISEAGSSTADVLREVQTFASQSKSKIHQQAKSIKRTLSGKNVRDIMDGAFQDIQNGTFSIGNLSEDSYSDMDTFDDILDEDISPEEISDPASLAMAESKRNIAILGNVVAKGNIASVHGMEEMTKTLATVNLKTANANMEKMTHLSLMGMNQMASSIAGVDSRLEMINSNLLSMMDFQRTNVAMLNEQTLKYQSETSQMMHEMGKSLSELHDFLQSQKELEPKKKKKGEEFDFSDSFNMNTYKDMVKNNFKNSSLGMASSVGSTMFSMMSAFGNPMEMIGPMALSALIPKGFKKSVERMDKSFVQGMNNLIYRIGDWKYSTDGIKQMIGSLFGKERERFKGPDISNFKKDSMGWNGIAQKTLVEVIPSYLAKIEAGVNKTEERYFNMDKGYFQTISSIKEKYQRSFSDTVEIGMNDMKESVSEALQKSGVDAETAKQIKTQISDAVYNALTTDARTGKTRQGYMRDIYKSMEGVLDEGTIHDIIRETSSGLDETMSRLNETVKKLNTASVNLFNSEGKEKGSDELFRRKNIFSNRKIKDGKFVEDLDDDELLDLEFDDLFNSDESKQRRYDELMKRLRIDRLGERNFIRKVASRFDPTVRKERLERSRRKYRKFDHYVDFAYDKMSGFDFRDDIDESIYSRFQRPQRREEPRKPENPTSTIAEANINSSGGLGVTNIYGNPVFNIYGTPTFNDRNTVPTPPSNPTNPAPSTSMAEYSESPSDSVSTSGLRVRNLNPINNFPQMDTIDPILGSAAPQLNPATSRETRENQSNIINFTRNRAASSRATRERATGGAEITQIQSYLRRSVDHLEERGFENALQSDQRRIAAQADETLRLVQGTNLRGNQRGPSEDDASNVMNFPASITQRLTEDENSIKSLVLSLNDNFLAPMVGGIFGKEGIIRSMFSDERIEKLRDKLFNEETGIFGGATTWMKDQMAAIRYLFDGKAYTDSEGNKYEENENSVFDHIAKGYDFLRRNSMEYVFGKDFEENEPYQNYLAWTDFKGKRDKKRADRIARAQEEEEIANGTKAANTISDRLQGILGVSDASPNTPQLMDDLNVIDAEYREITDDLQSSVNRNMEAIEPLSDSAEQVQNALMIIPQRYEEVSETIKSNLVNASETAALSIVDSAQQLSTNVIGEFDEQDQQQIRSAQQNRLKSFGDKVKSWLPKGLAAGVAGGLVGLSNATYGSGIIGSLFLPGGPVSGAILGVSASLLFRNQKFQKFLFGEEDENGNKIGGLISNKTRQAFKKNLPMIVGGATLGALKGFLRGNGVVRGPLGFFANSLLPGGPVGGAMLGLGLSLLKSNERFQKIMFGEKNENGKRDGGIIGSGMNGMKKAFSKSMPFVKGGLAGLGVAALSNVAVSKMGAIGSAMSLGGPIGWGIAGLGLGIAAQSERVKEMLFGTEEFDENGNSKGRKKDGFLHKMRNMLVMNVFDPIKEKMQENIEDFAFWAKKNITRPFRAVFGPILDSMKGVKKDISDAAHEAFNNVANTVGNALKSGVETVFKPLTSGFRILGKSLSTTAKVSAKMALSPISAPLKLLQFATANKRRHAKGEETKTIRQHLLDIGSGIVSATQRQWAEDDRDYGRGPLGGINKLLTHGVDIVRNTRQGFDAAKASYRREMGEQGFNSLNWMSIDDENRHDKEERKKLAKSREKWKAIDIVREDIARSLGHANAYYSSEGLKRVTDQLEAAGLTKGVIRNNEDLNNLLYNKTDFLDRMKKGEDVSGNNIKDSAATQDFYSSTKTYQSKVLEKFTEITREFTKYAARDALKRKGENIPIGDLKEMNDRFEKYGLSWEKDIGIDPSKIVDEGSIKAEDWQRYMEAKFDGNGNIQDDPTGFAKMVKTILDRKDEEEDSITSNLDHIRQATEANARMSMADQAIQTGASESDTESAAGFDMNSRGWRLPNLFNRKKKKMERDQREAAESDKVRNANTSSQDQVKENGDKEAKEGKLLYKEKKKGTVFGSLFGKIGDILGGAKGILTSGKFWKGVKITGGLGLLFAEDIAKFLGTVMQKASPIIDPVIENVKTKVPELMKSAGDFLNEKGPEIISNLVDRVVNNMDYIIDNAWDILSAGVSTIGKKLVNKVAELLNLPEPFKDASNHKSKTFDNSQEAAEYAEKQGMNFNSVHSNTTVTEGTEYIDPETGELKKVGSAPLLGTGIRFLQQSKRSPVTRGVAKYGTKAVFGVGKASLGLLQMVPVVKHPAKVASGVLKGVEKAVTGDESKLKSLLKFLDKVKKKILSGAKIVGRFIPSNKFTQGVEVLFKKVVAKASALKGKTLTKVTDAIASKIGRTTGKSVMGLTPLGAGFLATDLVSGAIGASYLFGVDEEHVDAVMRSISAGMRALLGSAVGVWFDLFAEIWHTCELGNIKQDLARKLYTLVGGGAALDEAVLEMEVMAEKYNRETGNNMTVDSFNELYNKKNSGMLSRLRQGADFIYSKITGKKDEYENKYHKYDALKEGLTQADYDAYYANHPEKKSSTSTISDNDLLAFGPGQKKRKRNRFYGQGLNQADPRWGNYPLGKFPNGQVSTMATGGCGPTALSMVAEKLGGNPSPVQVAQFAQKNGMIKDGGATESLFTKGASSMGLNANKVSKSGLMKSLQEGNPVVLSGKSSENGPYTEAGHVIMANGVDQKGNVHVKDPMRGDRSIPASKLTSSMTHAWSYSKGKAEGYGSGPVGYGTDDYAVDNLLRVSGKRKGKEEPNSIKTGLNALGNSLGSGITSLSKFLTDSFNKAKDKAQSIGDMTFGKMFNRGAMTADEYEQMNYSKGIWSFPEKSYFEYNGKRYQIIKNASELTASSKPYTAYEINKNADMSGWTQFKQNARAYAKGTSKWIEVAKEGQKVPKDLRTANPEVYNLSNIAGAKGGIEAVPEIKVKENARDRAKRIRENKGNVGDPLIDRSRVTGDMNLYPRNPYLPNETPGFETPQLTRMDQMVRDGSPNMLGTLLNEGTLKTVKKLDQKIQSGYQMTNGDYRFNDISFYRGLRVADIRAMAIAKPELLSDPAIPTFKSAYNKFVESGKYSIRSTLMDKDLKAIFGISAFVSALGGNGYYQDFEYKYGFPFYQTDDERWASIPWRGESVKTRGSDLASLAMVATAFAPNMLTPEYIYQNWLSKQKGWWSEGTGLNMDEIFADGGFNAMKASHVDGKRLKTNKISNISSIKSALQSKKPVVMTGHRYLGSMFGGFYHYGQQPMNGLDDQSTIVARAADNENVVVLDPFTTLDQNGVFSIDRLSDRIGNGSPIISAYSVTGPNGEGIDGRVDIGSKEGGKADYVSFKDAKGLDKIGAIFKNISALVSNFFDYSLGDSDVQKSIFDVNEIEGDGMDTEDPNSEYYNGSNESEPLVDVGEISEEQQQKADLTDKKLRDMLGIPDETKNNSLNKAKSLWATPFDIAMGKALGKIPVTTTSENIGSGSRDIVFGPGIKGVQQHNGKRHIKEAKNRKIDYIVMHYTASTSSKEGSAEGSANWFDNPDAKGSADFIVDDATAIQYNPDILNQYTQAVGGEKFSNIQTSIGAQLYEKATNKNSVSIEMASNKKNKSTTEASDRDWYFTDATMNNGAQLANTLMAKLNIPKSNVIMHHQVNGKPCPAMWTHDDQSLEGWREFRKRLNGEEDPELMLNLSGNGDDSTSEKDFDSLTFSQKIAAVGKAFIASKLGDDYETAKMEAMTAMLGGSNSNESTENTGDGSLPVGNFQFTETTGEELPVPEGYGKVLSYMAWQKIKSKSSMQYKLKQEAEGYDSDGMGKVGDRYAVAVKPYYGLTGDLLNVRREDGSVQKVIVADVKGSENGSTGLARYVHSDGSVVEYVIDGNKFTGGDSTYKGTKSVNDVHPEWKKNILGITKVGNFWENKVNSSPSVYGSLKHSKAVGYGGNWLATIAATNNALAHSCTKYSQSTWVDVTVGGRTLKVRTDCSGLVGSALEFYGVKGANGTASSWYTASNSTLPKYGFTFISWPGWEGLKPGDIIANPGSHVEVFAGIINGQRMVYNAGSTDSITNPGITKTGHASYRCVWRPNSAGSADGISLSSGISDGTSSGESETPLSPFEKLIKDLTGVYTDMMTTEDGKVIGFGKGNTPANWFTKTLKGRITSGYGQRSTELGNEYHRGMDISADSGTDILSPIDGNIVSTGSDAAGYGNYAVVRDAYGDNHIFAHMEKPVGYGIGDMISKNDVIGQVGSSGKSTGDHLHYEIRKNGNKYSTKNPFEYKYDNSRDYNITKLHTTSSHKEEREETPAVGSGNKDINAKVQEKLNVAINTENIEEKMNVMIEALKIIAENSSKPMQQTSNTVNNNTTNAIAYGPGGKNVTVSTSKPKKKQESTSLAQIHKAIASRR